jgi:hypothetical protein
VLRDLLSGSLEVALGLETAHPEVLEKLNKKFDLAQFARAAEFLAAERIALRVFLLVNPPFLDERAGLEWAVKSAEFAFACGAGAVALLPTRTGNGAMERRPSRCLRQPSGLCSRWAAAGSSRTPGPSSRSPLVPIVSLLGANGWRR